VDHDFSADRRSNGTGNMPKVFITEEQRQLNKIFRYIRGEAAIQGIKNKDIAEALDITPPAVTYMFKNQSMSLEAFVKVMNLLGKDAAECISSD
jgi:CRISPR/Cas system CSM-associated protein Csm2 small subunit